jgi:hypothetical protein
LVFGPLAFSLSSCFWTFFANGCHPVKCKAQIFHIITSLTCPPANPISANPREGP